MKKKNEIGPIKTIKYNKNQRMIPSNYTMEINSTMSVIQMNVNLLIFSVESIDAHLKYTNQKTKHI